MHDAELRDAFHRLREEEMARAPRFRPRPAATHPSIVWRFAAALLLIVAIALVLPLRRNPPAVESIVTWKAPTDVLLRTPGREVLSTVPRIPDLSERTP